MSRTFTLESPFVTYTLNYVPKHWKLILSVWIIFWLLVVLGLIYLFSVVLPEHIGFETTLLVGIALLILTVSQD